MQHALGEVTPDALLAFHGYTALFTLAGVPLAPDAMSKPASMP